MLFSPKKKKKKKKHTPTTRSNQIGVQPKRVGDSTVVRGKDEHTSRGAVGVNYLLDFAELAALLLNKNASKRFRSTVSSIEGLSPAPTYRVGGSDSALGLRTGQLMGLERL